MNSRITVEVVKLPASRRNVTLFEGDTVNRALIEAFGEDDYSKYTITVNGEGASLTTPLRNGSSIAISKQIKGNADEEAVEETAEETVETPATPAEGETPVTPTEGETAQAEPAAETVEANTDAE